MNIIYSQNNKVLFIQKWQEYLHNNLVSYKYLIDYIDYMLYYTTNLLLDGSFVVLDNNDRCLGICFLPIEKNNGYNTISLANGYTISPLYQNKKIEKVIFDEIDKIVDEYRIKQIKFYIDPLIRIYEQNSNILLKYGFVNTSTTTGLVNLKNNSIWTNIRKRYKSMINKVLKDDDFKISIINRDNVDYEIHEFYRYLHEKCAGRVTRDKKTFDKQFEMLQKDNATLIGLKYKDNYIGMQYFFHFQKTVVYASGADDPKYTKKGFNIYHPILWTAQKYFKECEFEYLDYSQPFGYSLVQGFNAYHDEKQLNISYFKRGMGAEMKTLSRGIRYFDKELFINDIEIYKNRVNEV